MEAVRQETPFLYKGDDICIICREDLDNTYVVAHEDQDMARHLHPLHEDCRNNLLEFLGGSPYNCPMCRVPLAGNPIPPIRGPYDPTVQVWHDYPKDKLPEELLSDLRRRETIRFTKGFLDGITLCCCNIVTLSKIKQMAGQVSTPLLFNPIIDNVILPVFFTGVLSLTLGLGTQIIVFESKKDITPPPIKFIFSRTIVNIYRDRLDTSYITALFRGILVAIGAMFVSLSLKTPEGWSRV